MYLRRADPAAEGSGFALGGRSSRLILIGLEGLCPELFRRAVEAGACPRLLELRERGSLAPVMPTVPIEAATGWASLGTGAFPSAHGVTGLVPYVPGANVEAASDYRMAEDEAVRTIGGRARAEWLWQTAARAGKRVVLVGFPGGWPPSGESPITVDGAGPVSSRGVRLTDAHLFATRTAGIEGATHLLRTTQPSGWANPPDSARAPLEAAFIVTGEAELQPTSFGWMVEARNGETPKVDPALMYCCLIVACGGAGEGEEDPPFDTLIVCRGRDAESPVARLKVGEWSGWITEEVKTADGPHTVRFKFRLEALSPGGRELALYRTPMFRTDAWAHPEAVAERLIEASLETGANDRTLRGAAEGLAWMCAELCQDRDWDLLLTHLPEPDTLLHEMLNELHPASPQYRPDAEEAAWERICRVLTAVDRFVGEVVDACADDETAVAVVSPHGMIPAPKYVWLGKPLVDAGLATYVTDEPTDGMRLHLPQSRAVLGDHPLVQSVWVNLQGREPEGIVPPEHYERVRTEIINALLSARDPFTNACPVALALRREEAGFLGLAAEALGDVVYFLAPGYATDPRICSTGLVDPSFISVDGVHGGAGPLQGAHHGYLPGAELGGFSVQGVLLLAGPGVRRGFERAGPLRTPDVTSTLCHLLGLEAPADAEGLVAADLLLP
jgi:predicted AlkP superfamily phosphohydrolase/phosphomutase